MARPNYDSVVLVTGFPSFSARSMVRHLLTAEPRALVYVIVMSKLASQARAALDALPAEARRRVVALEGDAAAMDLGLSGAELRQLAAEVDRIHHIAHLSYAGVDRKEACLLYTSPSPRDS